MAHPFADLPATLAPKAPAVQKAPTKIATGLAQGTKVMTMDGAIPVEFLAEGDRIVTRAGVRRLVRLEVTEYDTPQTCHISASTLGHDKPEADVILGPATPVYIRDWRAKALYGRSQVLVHAGRLADGAFVAIEEGPKKMRFFTLVFDTPEIFYAEGLEIASAA